MSRNIKSNTVRTFMFALSILASATCDAWHGHGGGWGYGNRHYHGHDGGGYGPGGYYGEGGFYYGGGWVALILSLLCPIKDITFQNAKILKCAIHTDNVGWNDIAIKSTHTIRC